MSEEKETGVRHVFDGIEELDNRLPNWWLSILWTTVVFGFGYWFFYHTTSLGDSSAEELKGELAALKAQRPKEQPLSDALLSALASDPTVVQSGREVYVQSCAACHAQEGQGLVGPNLTDGFFLHGAKPMDIFKAVDLGFTDKGMPPWGATLGVERTKAVSAYVLSLKGKNLAGKAPQGEPET